jgi:hypothetical protein
MDKAELILIDLGVERIKALESENAALKAKLLRAHRYSCTPTNCMLDGGVEHAQAFEKGGESDGQD